MRVVILGGYGVFGGRLARLLLRDGHEVWIAGRRRERAERFAAEHGGHPLALDLQGDLAPILSAAPEVVVDAAGPFQAYGDDPYRVPGFCIENGINYLDLSDDAAFTAGISELDDRAKDAGCFALSGASSVPAISSAAVAELASDLEEIEVVDTAILPGNRAPRGRSVMASILGQIGAPLKVWRGGQWRAMRSWSDPHAYRVGNAFRRRAWLIGVPDLVLFPGFFSARSVVFRAGMELSVMNGALSCLAVLRRPGLARMNDAVLAIVRWLAMLLERFGSDRGGMVVAVTGRRGGAVVTRRWELVAERGEGPFIPAVAARALLRKADRIASGARACLAEVTLAEIEEAMSDLAVSTSRSEAPDVTLFQAALGPRWHDLPPTVRRMHSVRDVQSFSGRAQVTRGTSPLARFAAWFFGFPEAGADVPLTVTKTRTDAGETWERNFAGKVFRSYLTPSRPGHYRERFWALDYEQELPVIDGALHFVVRRGWFLGFPLPRPLLPHSDSREFEVDGRFRFDVALSAPLGGGLIVRYQGSVSADEGAAGAVEPTRSQNSTVSCRRSASCATMSGEGAASAAVAGTGERPAIACRSFLRGPSGNPSFSRSDSFRSGRTSQSISLSRNTGS